VVFAIGLLSPVVWAVVLARSLTRQDVRPSHLRGL
jgi:hypothetical protein